MSVIEVVLGGCVVLHCIIVKAVSNIVSMQGLEQCFCFGLMSYFKESVFDGFFLYSLVKRFWF